MMGLNTSAELRSEDCCPVVLPPAIKTPETKHNNVPPLTVSQRDNCNLPGGLLLLQITPAAWSGPQDSLVSNVHSWIVSSPSLHIMLFIEKLELIFPK